MNSIYLVFAGNSTTNPVIASYDINEANKLAAAINDDEISNYVKEVPILSEPKACEIKDVVEATIYATQQTYGPLLEALQNLGSSLKANE